MSIEINYCDKKLTYTITGYDINKINKNEISLYNIHITVIHKIINEGDLKSLIELIDLITDCNYTVVIKDHELEYKNNLYFLLVQTLKICNKLIMDYLNIHYKEKYKKNSI